MKALRVPPGRLRCLGVLARLRLLLDLLIQPLINCLPRVPEVPTDADSIRPNTPRTPVVERANGQLKFC